VVDAIGWQLPGCWQSECHVAHDARRCVVPRLRCALVVVDSLAHGYSRMKQLMPDPVIVLFAMDDMAAVGMR